MSSDAAFDAAVSRAMAKPVDFVGADGHRRRTYAGAPLNEVSSRHARTRLSHIASRLMSEDSHALLVGSRVSPAKQAKALRVRVAKFSGRPGPVSSIDEPEEDADGAARGSGNGGSGAGGDIADDDGNEADGGGAGIDALLGQADAADAALRGRRAAGSTAAAALGGGGVGGGSERLRVSPIRARNVGSSADGTEDEGSGRWGAPSSSSSASSPSLSSPTSPRPGRRLNPLPVPLVLRRADEREALRPRLDLGIEPVGAAISEWTTPTRLYVWGAGTLGQLGCGLDEGRPAVPATNRPMRVDLPGSQPGAGGADGTAAASSSFKPSGPRLTPVRVAAGRTATLVVDNQRRVWACGDGWLGRGPERERSHVPVLVGGGLGLGSMQVADLACGDGFFVACTVEGACVVWGENLTLAALALSTAAKQFRKDYGPLGLPIERPESLGRVVSSSAPTPASASASASAPGLPSRPAANGASGAGAASSSSYGHPLGLPPGELPRVPLPRALSAACFGGEPVVAVACGEGHVVALTGEGSVYTWGAGTSGACGHGSVEHCWQPRLLQLRPRGARNGGDGAGGGGGGAAAGRGGRWDADLSDGDGEGEGEGNVGGGSALAGGSSSSPSVARGGGLDAESIGAPARASAKGAAGRGGRMPREAAGAGVGAGSALTSIAEGGGSPLPASGSAAALVTRACAVSAGAHHTAILACDGTVHVCGWADKGRLGLGIDVPAAVARPTQLHGVPLMVGVACGGAHTLLLSADGRVYATGDNTAGQCGVNSRIFRGSSLAREDAHGVAAEVSAERRVLVPRQVFSPLFGGVLVRRVAAGARTSCAVDLSGRMWAWGLNDDGTLGDGSDETTPEPVRVARFGDVSVLQVSLSASHSCAVVGRSRAAALAAPAAAIAQLDDDSGLVSALEPPLPLVLRRARRQGLCVRLKAVAFAALVRRRRARERRRRAIRRVALARVPSYEEGAAILAADMRAERDEARLGLGPGHGAGAGVGAGTSVLSLGDAGHASPTLQALQALQALQQRQLQRQQREQRQQQQAQAVRQAQAEAARHRYEAADALRRDLSHWEHDPDDTEFGKNAAAHVMQSAFLRFVANKRARRAEAAPFSGLFAASVSLGSGGSVTGSSVGSWRPQRHLGRGRR